MSLFLAAVPAILFLANLRRYRRPALAQLALSPVSILIPARNEERSIVAAVQTALASSGVTFEVIVLDDHSEDSTAELVADLTCRDPRLRLIHGAALPAGWCGKQHACAQLAQAAVHSCLLFLDADVRLAPDGVARLAMFLHQSKADLVSGIPYQETAGFVEKLVLPLIHFVLLGFLPLGRMRQSSHPAYSAGCGQLFLALRESYNQAGGHSAIRTSLHDGIKLPHAFRVAGLKTDLCDANDLAACRMYRGAGELWLGLAKNATEGLANPTLIGPATLFLLGGQVLPFLLLAGAFWSSAWAVGLAGGAVVFAYVPRLAGAIRFRQSWLGAFLHPLGVAVLVAIQWYGLVRWALGRPASWKGRNYRTREKQETLPSPPESRCSGAPIA
jgi:hypothetical protein